MMETKSLIFRAKFSYFNNNVLHFKNVIEIGLRFSLWKNENNFTTGMLFDICDGSIYTGQTKDVVIKTINSEVSRNIKKGDSLYWGIPYMTIGKIEIEEVVGNL